MKTLFVSFLFLPLLFLIPVQAQKGDARQKQKPKFEQVVFKTSGQCEMCKARIETAARTVKGVKTTDFNMQDKAIAVTYDVSKTNPDAIRTAISKAGYDADGVKADEAAYAKLPKCCKRN